MHGPSRISRATALLTLLTTTLCPLCSAADEALVARAEALDGGFPVGVLGNTAGAAMVVPGLTTHHSARGPR